MLRDEALSLHSSEGAREEHREEVKLNLRIAQEKVYCAQLVRLQEVAAGDVGGEYFGTFLEFGEQVLVVHWVLLQAPVVEAAQLLLGALVALAAKGKARAVDSGYRGC